MKKTWILREKRILENLNASLEGWDFKAKPLKVVVERYRKKRSLNANRYYWFLLEFISEFTGYTVNELHDFFRRVHLPPKIITMGGKKVETLASTADLNTVEFGEYIEGIIRTCAQELELALPPPEGSWAA